VTVSQLSDTDFGPRSVRVNIKPIHANVL